MRSQKRNARLCWPFRSHELHNLRLIRLPQIQWLKRRTVVVVVVRLRGQSCYCYTPTFSTTASHYSPLFFPHIGESWRLMNDIQYYEKRFSTLCSKTHDKTQRDTHVKYPIHTPNVNDVSVLRKAAQHTAVQPCEQRNARRSRAFCCVCVFVCLYVWKLSQCLF